MATRSGSGRYDQVMSAEGLNPAYHSFFVSLCSLFRAAASWLIQYV